MNVPAGTIRRAGRREWIGLGVITLPCLLYSMDLTVLDLAVPQLSAALRPTSAQLLWIVDIYGFVLAGFLIPMGTLGDRIGRRRLLLAGAAAFGLASVFAAFATSANMLIVARAVLGIAGATLAPSTLSLIRNMFLDARQRTTAIGVWTTSYSVGAAIGPLLGGVLLGRFWWGSVFLIGVPVMLLLLASAPLLLPEFRDPNAKRIDLLSAMLSLGTILPAIYGMKQIAQGGAGWPSLVSIVVGIAVGIVFVVRQRTLVDPLIDLRLFQSRTFSAALGAYTLVTFVLFGIYVFIAQWLQLVRGLTPLQTAVYMLPIFACFILGSMFTPMLVQRVRPATIMVTGMILGAIGFVLLAGAAATSGIGLFMVGCVAYAAGLAPVFTLTTDMIVGAAPPERAGVAAALSETGSELGGALGIAVLGSIGTAVYHGTMANGVPAGVPAATSAAARGTLGGALAAGMQLPERVGAQLIGVARGAFSLSFTVVAAVSALVIVATAIAVTLTYRIRSESGYTLERAITGARRS